MSKKSREELQLNDDGPNYEAFSKYWNILLDHGYQGMLELLQVVTPKKKTPGKSLTREERKRNFEMSHDRIIAETYFGQLCMLWSLKHKKFRWVFGKYKDWVKLAIVLT